MTRGSFLWKISGSNGASEKEALISRSEYSKRKFVFHFLKATFDTNFRLCVRFSVNGNDL